MAEQYTVERTHVRDLSGRLLFEKPMMLSRLHAIGEVFVHDKVGYVVKRVAVADDVQHVNVVPASPSPR